CAARIEKKLNRMEGVTATVNFATEKAKVSYSDRVAVTDLIATVEKTGYTAEEPLPPVPPSGEEAKTGPAAADGESASLRQRLLVSLALS
ncbi:cation transporter, partial [Streptomyces rubiginosohelvolus]